MMTTSTVRDPHRDATREVDPHALESSGVMLAARPGASPTLPPSRFETELEEAEELLKYAATIGVDIDDQVRRDVLAAKLRSHDGWTLETTSSLLAALTKLSAKMKPVSGESLRQCVVKKEAAATLRTFRWVAISLGVIIIPFSIAAFVATATCDAIRKDIEVANHLAVTLGVQVSRPRSPAPSGNDSAAPSESELRDLQQFAATIRAIDARARSLSVFGRKPLGDSEKAAYELPRPPFDPGMATALAIESYQKVRFQAQSVQETVATTFGALTTCLLPLLFALLGACAYLIRLFEGQIIARTFTGADRLTARFLIAAIGGLVVGLFGDFGSGHGAVLPPLALAFLVGYGVDVFFYFLDGLLQTFAQPQKEVAKT